MTRLPLTDDCLLDHRGRPLPGGIGLRIMRRWWCGPLADSTDRRYIRRQAQADLRHARQRARDRRALIGGAA